MAAKVFKMVLAASLAAAAHSLATPQPPRTPPAAEAPAKSPSVLQIKHEALVMFGLTLPLESIS
jgi:hypothetical protein